MRFALQTWCFTSPPPTMSIPVHGARTAMSFILFMSPDGDPIQTFLVFVVGSGESEGDAVHRSLLHRCTIDLNENRSAKSAAVTLQAVLWPSKERSTPKREIFTKHFLLQYGAKCCQSYQSCRCEFHLLRALSDLAAAARSERRRVRPTAQQSTE